MVFGGLSQLPAPIVGQASIFQSKDDPEIRFGFQYKVILKNDEEAAERPISLLGFLFRRQRNSSRRREPRVGKWET
jgi:hypothetical protein